MKVARYDYSAQLGPDLDAVMATLRTAIRDGEYGVDGHVQTFEREFAAYIGSRWAVGVNTGTDALVLALMACGIGPGDEVITQANTFNATVAAIVLTGATPVLVDADPDTFLLDVDRVTGVATERTRAIIPVHLFGKPVALTRITSLAKRLNAVVIEDAAQAHGARWPSGQVAGTAGLAGCFSFHPSKNLAAAGDAGMVVTDDEHLAMELRRRRALGQRAQNDHVVVGLNSKLHALQAVILSAKLPKLEEWNSDRRRIAEAYRTGLHELPVTFQREDRGERHAYHLFQLRTAQRDGLLHRLRARGIDATVRYPTPIHLQPAFARFGWAEGDYPVAEALARELVCLPTRPGMPSEEIDHVIRTTTAFFGKHA